MDLTSIITGIALFIPDPKWFEPPTKEEIKEQARLDRGDLTPEEIKENLDFQKGCSFWGNLIMLIWVIGGSIVLLAIAFSLVI